MENLFLYGETAQKLYGRVKNLPIIDYHCHLSPKKSMKTKPYMISAKCGFRGITTSGA